MKTRNRFSIILLLCTVLFVFSACNRGETTDTEPDDAERSTVFSEQVISLPDGWEVENSPTITCRDGVISASVWRKTGELDAHGYDKYEMSTARITPDGTLLSIGDTVYKEGAAAAVDTGSYAVQHGGRMIDVYPLSVYPQDGSGALGYEALYTEYEADVWLHRFDKKGNVLYSLCPAGDLGYDLSRDVGNMSGDVFTVADVVTLFMGEGLQHVVLTTAGLVSYNDSGEKLWTLSGGGTPVALLPVGERVLYLSVDRKGVQSLRLLDLVTGKQGDTVVLPSEVTQSTFGSIEILAGDGHDLYVKNSRGLWGLDFTEDGTGTLTAETVLVIDWVQSDIAPSALKGACVVDAETAVFSTIDVSDVINGVNTLSIYHMVPKSRIVPKTEIVLAVLDELYDLQYAVRTFNKSSDTHRIVIRDYTQYEYGEVRKKAFDTDIAAGKIPDMIVMATRATSFDTLVSTYERSPLLCDLTPLLKADADFNYNDLLSYITKPYQWSGERQYIFPLYPGARTIWGRREDFPEGFVTAEEFLSVAEDWETPFSMTSPLVYVREIGVADCVDEENAVCSFDDGYLLQLLNRASAIPFDRDALDTSIGAEELFRTGQLRLTEGQYHSLYKYAIGMHTLGGDAVPVGYFNREGVHAMGFTLSSYFAITEPSRHKAVCVDFLQNYIDIKRNSQLKAHSSGGSTYYRDDIADQLAFYEGKTIVVNDRSSSVVEDAEAVGLPGVHIKITAEDAEGYLYYLDSIERRIDGNTQPAAIFDSEYWNDDGKPLDEKLKLIQSKVSIYLSEQAD